MFRHSTLLYSLQFTLDYIKNNLVIVQIPNYIFGYKEGGKKFRYLESIVKAYSEKILIKQKIWIFKIAEIEGRYRLRVPAIEAPMVDGDEDDDEDSSKVT